MTLLLLLVVYVPGAAFAQVMAYSTGSNAMPMRQSVSPAGTTSGARPQWQPQVTPPEPLQGLQPQPQGFQQGPPQGLQQLQPLQTLPPLPPQPMQDSGYRSSLMRRDSFGDARSMPSSPAMQPAPSQIQAVQSAPMPAGYAPATAARQQPPPQAGGEWQWVPVR